ncbi:MAG: enoyl-CoA hydratase [Deltaproteobacteria bacterium]|nr:MAG: enoyl-CoA hydratase [Deltaproteobacteria bacterium]
MAEYETLTAEYKDHVMLVGLNRPAKRNAFNLKMLEELARAYTEYEEYDEARCMVLFAHGGHFTAGLDLAEVGPAVASGKPLVPAGLVDPLDLGERRRTKPVVMAVQGWCLTIGVELLLASDIRLAATDCRFAQMEVRRGIMPFGGATLRFPLLCGWGNAMRWLLTGGEFDATEALRIGLVQEVCEPTTLVARAEEIASEVAAQAPLAVRATLLSARRAVEDGFGHARHSLMDEARRLMFTDDAREGLMSFIERRQAKFRGK